MTEDEDLELSELSIESLIEQLIDVSLAIHEEQEIGQVTPSWRREKQAVIDEIKRRAK